MEDGGFAMPVGSRIQALGPSLGFRLRPMVAGKSSLRGFLECQLPG